MKRYYNNDLDPNNNMNNINEEFLGYYDKITFNNSSRESIR